MNWLRPVLAAITTRICKQTPDSTWRGATCSWHIHDKGGWTHSLYTGEVFGGTAIELTGIVVRPGCQARGIGARMLHEYMKENNERAGLVTAHTRNPAILRMLAKVCGDGNVYPLCGDENLQGSAAQIPGTIIAASGAYHLNRYGDAGLYGAAALDPADRPYGVHASLKERFPLLDHPGNALVVVARKGQGGVR